LRYNIALFIYIVRLETIVKHMHYKKKVNPRNFSLDRISNQFVTLVFETVLFHYC